ncbi:MAG: ABC transporter permease [Bacillota bacterium]
MVKGLFDVNGIKQRIGKSQLISNFLAIIAIMLIFTIFNRRFIAFSNLSDVLRSFSFLGIAALGQTLVMISGGIDLSVGGIAGLSAITAGFLMDKMAVHPYWILVIGILVGLACGIVNGFIVTKLKIVPFIATLGTAEVFFGLVMVVTQGVPIFTIPKEVQNVASMIIGGIPLPILVFAIIAFITYYLLRYTVIGRNIFSVGGNPQAAKICGISVEGTQFFLYTLSGVLAGIGGILALSWLGSGQPTIGQDWLLPGVAATIIGGTNLTGGKGSIMGTISGILLLGFLDNGLTMLNVSPYWRGAVTGIILVLAVLIDVLRNKEQE